MGFLPQHHHRIYVWIPLVGSLVWFATLWALLITWLVQGRPRYSYRHGKIPFISDIAAEILKPLFIVGCVITGVSYFLSMTIERWLRYEGRLLPNIRRIELVFSSLAIFWSFVGGCGLILLSIFDTNRFSCMHRFFLFVFIVGVGLSAIFTVLEYWWISHEYAEFSKSRAIYIAKSVIAGLLIILAIAFAILSYTATDRDPGAVVEWIIAFGFTFYLLTFFLDLRMSEGIHRGKLSRERLPAMKQDGQIVTVIREANEAGGGNLAAGMDQDGHGYPHDIAQPNGHAYMTQEISGQTHGYPG